MSNKIPEKLQAPLQDKEGPFYPLTTYDQIIMPDGISRFDGGVMVDRTNAVIGEPALTNADMLGGIPAEEYLLKTESNFPIATREKLGMVIVGDGLQIIDGVLSLSLENAAEVPM